jgi:hypothetical protein
MPADDTGPVAARPPERAGLAARLAEPGLSAIARAIIDANRYMTLATADEDGQPWAAPVFYATADYTEFYWISTPAATHSRNLGQRPSVSIVIFDSGAAEGSGQAVYMSATAGQVADRDLGRALAVYPGPAEPGASPLSPGQLRGAAPQRLYRAEVSRHWILCPRDAGPCPLHGRAFDHRVAVRVVLTAR